MTAGNFTYQLALGIDFLEPSFTIQVTPRSSPYTHPPEHTAIVHNGNMYIFGGYYRNYQNDLFCYDFKTGTYSTLPNNSQVA
jgi:hypothetical protein